MVWYSHVFQNFPQFIVIHTVKGFGIVNKAEINVFSGTLLLFQWWVIRLAINPIFKACVRALGNGYSIKSSWFAFGERRI